VEVLLLLLRRCHGVVGVCMCGGGCHALGGSGGGGGRFENAVEGVPQRPRCFVS
jgi:hypothetical protein